jgi:hypothetical protein
MVFLTPNVKAQARRFLASPGAPCWALMLAIEEPFHEEKVTHEKGDRFIFDVKKR